MEYIEWTLVYFMVPVVIGLLLGAVIGSIYMGTISIVLKVDSKNKVHFYVARDENTVMYLYLGKPVRGISCFYPGICGGVISSQQHFENFNLKVKDFKDLKWEDDPVEVFVNMDH